jgi:hypothetical protein
LGVNGDAAAAGQFFEIDAAPASLKAQCDSAMPQAFAFQPLANSRPDEEIDCALFQHAGPDPLFDVFTAAGLNHDRMNSFEMQQVGQHQPCWAGAHDGNLGVHHADASLIADCNGVRPSMTVAEYSSENLRSATSRRSQSWRRIAAARLSRRIIPVSETSLLVAPKWA